MSYRPAEPRAEREGAEAVRAGGITAALRAVTRAAVRQVRKESGVRRSRPPQSLKPGESAAHHFWASAARCSGSCSAASHRSAILELGDEVPLHDYIRVREGETDQVPTKNPGVVAGMNTPEEYKRLLDLYHAATDGHRGRTA